MNMEESGFTTLSPEVLWLDLSERIIKEIAAISFDTWIKPLVPVKLTDEGTLYLAAPSGAGRDMVMKNYHSKLTNIIHRINPGYSIVVTDEKSNAAVQEKVIEAPKSVIDNTPQFKQAYTFESFVVGRCNQVAYAIATAVAEEPGKRHNPLFIYGGVGLGKTHLMHAIGNQICANYPVLKVIYVTFEKFMNELIYSLGGSRQQSEEFRKKYRSVDVLMVDDIQFIAGKERTQEEFFHTFEELYNSNKQIIICSDRPAKDINPLEERLRSRFNWDMTVDIQPADLETRIAILQKKAQLKRVNVKPEVLQAVAERVSSNIREMEGVFSKVVSLAQLQGRQPTVELVKEIIKDYADDSAENISVDTIIDAVCSYYKVTREEMTGKKKNKEIVEPRMVCIYIITETMQAIPLVKIGQIFGNRDHTTIIHARDKISDQVKTNNRIKIVVKDILAMVKK